MKGRVLMGNWCRWLTLMLAVATLAGCKVDQFPPELWSVNPSRFDIGRPVVLQGAQFGADPIVTFGLPGTAVQAVITAKTNESITAIVPRVPTGATQIQVANSQGLTPPISFTVIQPEPLISAVIPTNAPPGATIHINGTNLDRLQSIRFDTTRATSFTVVSPTDVLVTIPAQQPRGYVPITVITEGGPRSYPDFLVAGTPEIISFTPKRTRTGQEIVVQGRYLTDGILRINRATTDLATTRTSDTEIRATIPADATSGRISVTVFDRLTGLSADSIYIAAAPAVTVNPSPSEGIVGDKVLLTGLNLRDVTSLTFGNTAATFRIISDTQIEVTVPARSQSGEVTIALSGVGGSTTVTQPFLYILPPANLVITPLRRGITKLVSVTGQNLWRIQQVTLNGKPITIHTRTEGTDFQFFVPSDASSGVITATNRAGTATSIRALTVVQSPTVTDYPRRAPVGGRMVLKGSWLRDAVVQFTGAASPAANDGRNEDAELWIRVPDDAQPGQFRLITDAPTVFTSDLFTPIRAVSGVAFTPARGQPGDVLTATGQFLEDVTEVRFGGGTSAAAAFQWLPNGQMKITVPTNAMSGSICFTNPAGTACTTTPFVVPRVVSGVAFTPKTAKVGAEITFTGQNLADVIEVRFGGGKSSVALFRVIGNTLLVTVPADATDGPICLTTDSGTTCTTDFFTVGK